VSYILNYDRYKKVIKTIDTTLDKKQTNSNAKQCFATLALTCGGIHSYLRRRFYPKNNRSNG